MEPQLVTTEYLDKQMLLAGKASVTDDDFSGPLLGAKVGLFVADIVPSKGLTVGDLTEAEHGGYARKTITWGAPKRDEDGRISMDSGLSTWQPNSDATPETVYGYFITDSAGTALLGLAKLENPKALVDTLSDLGLVVSFVQSNVNGGRATVTE